jgi:hypothetical protein
MPTKKIPRTLSRISRVLARLALVSILLAALAHATTAYTLVFRDGHQLRVSSVFTVTSNTFTYEAAPGITRTVQLILIDVAATERANNEAPGSFFKHATPDGTPAASPSVRHAARTLTNRDLESIRQRRVESEQKYDQRRIELGLPSVEESRRREALAEESILALARERATAEANDEAYWRSRAGALRNEIVTVDAEINYLRGRLGPVNQFPLNTQSFGSSAVIVGRPFGERFSMRQPGAGRMGTAPAGPLSNMGAAALRPSRPAAGFGFPRGTFGSAFGFPSLPFLYGDGSFERTDLGVRLNGLLTRRAGLDALWRELENEARIAKVPQVWLAP